MKPHFFAALMLSALFLDFNTLSATSITSAGSGNWASSATWTPSQVPTDVDDVTIAAGHTVTVDGNSACKSLTVNGILQFGSSDCDLDVSSGDLLMGGTGTLRASDAFTSGYAFHNLNLYGNFTVNGSFAAMVNGSVSDARAIIVSMRGSSKAIGGAGPIGIPALYIRATTTLNVAVNNCDELHLVSGNLDNTAANITMTGYDYVYRSAGTISVVPLWASDAQVAYDNSSPITAGAELPSSIYDLNMMGSGGVTLNKSITVTSYLRISSGILTTSNANLLTIGPSVGVYGGSSSSFVDGPLAATWATSTIPILFPIGKGTAYRPLEIWLTTPSSPVLKVEVFNSNCGGNKGALDAISTVRYYRTILFSGSATNGGKVMITYDADDGVSGDASLVVAQSTTVNGTYTSLGRSASTATTVTSDGDASPYNPASGDFLVLGSTGSNPLPVELTSFSASLAGMDARLEWATSTERNNYGFDVERRGVTSNQSPVVSWLKIGFVEGAGTSNSPHSYSFVDRTAGGGTYSYRLKQIDRDGNSVYSKSVGLDISAACVLSLSENYPNPFNPTTVISYQLPVNGYVTLRVYDQLGREVTTLVNEKREAGSYQEQFDGSGLSSGVYLYRLTAGGSVQTHKMILLK